MANDSDDQAARRRARQRRLDRGGVPATPRAWGAAAPLIGYSGGTGYGAMGEWAPRIRDIDDAPVMDPPSSRR